MELIQGDCLDVMAGFESESVDMILCDPPYGTTQCKWDSIIPLEPMWEQLKRVIKPNGAIVMTASQPFTTNLISSNYKMFKYCWVWEKPKGTGHLNARKQPMNNYEEVCVFYSKQCNYTPQMTLGEAYRAKSGKSEFDGYGKDRRIGSDNSGYRYPKRIQKFIGVERNTLHPTQKPVALMEYLIKTYTNEGETVLDFAMGSGTTGVACKNLRREFIGIELDEGYFNIAVGRIGLTTLDNKG